jgi:SAM-dependent methyltransferase
MAAIYAPALWTRVPYYPTSNAAYPLILAELPTDRPFTFVDIGCGFGDLIFFLRKHRPNGTFVGVEIGILPYLVAYGKTIARRERHVTIAYQDMWKLSLADFDFVYAFLSPAAMTRVWKKATTEMKPEATFITNSFETGTAPTYVVPVKDERASSLFIHKMPKAKRTRGAA